MRGRMRLAFVVMAFLPGFALAAGLVSESDTVASVAAAQKGKKVTLKLKSGQELTGTVRAVGKNLVELGELTGREFFDAAVSLADIEAVVVRVR